MFQTGTRIRSLFGKLLLRPNECIIIFIENVQTMVSQLEE